MFPENALIVIQGGQSAGKTTLAQWIDESFKGDSLVWHIDEAKDIDDAIRFGSQQKTTMILVLQRPLAETKPDFTPDMIITVERGKK